MAIQSKFFSTCKLCGKRIKKGDWIDNKNSLKIWAHQNCQTVTDPKAKGASINSALSGTNSLSPEISDIETEAFSLPSNFIPSIFQEAIFEWIINGEGHGVIEAVAGSGKTTTIVKSLEYIPLAILVELGSIPRPQTYKDLSILDGKQDMVSAYLSKFQVAFLAYNKHIAGNLKDVMRSKNIDYVHASTIHSLAGAAVVKAFVGIKLDKDKIYNIMDRFWPTSKTILNAQGEKVENPTSVRHVNKAKRFSMSKLVSLAKATLVDYRDQSAIDRMIEFYGMEIPEDIIEEVTKELPRVMNACKADTRTMDYDDMIWFCIVHNLQVNKFHYVFVDEFQDLNNQQIEFIVRSLDEGGRIIGVGDRKQSLYGFRGADIEAIPRMIKTLAATVLALSISYRCPSSHVQLAKGIVPQIEASENAIVGEVIYIKYEKFLKQIEDGDMIVCRTNAPLVKPAFQAIRDGKKAVIRGSDIGASLIEFIGKFEANDLSHLDILMSEYTAKEYKKLLDRGREMQAELALDKYDTIKSVANECSTVEDLISKLSILFGDGKKGIIFSSIHRAKGLEAENVFILRPDLMPHPKAKQDWELTQESNAQYVAYTRSKNKLYFVEQEKE